MSATLYHATISNRAGEILVPGRVTRDVELRYTPQGTAVANVSVAASRSWKPEGSEEWQQKTAFLSCTVWGDAAVRANSIKKGEIVDVVFHVADLAADVYKSKDVDEQGNPVYKASLKVGRAQVYRRDSLVGTGAEDTAPEEPVEDPVTF
jgi:single stranded DNA-binding protein